MVVTNSIGEISERLMRALGSKWSRQRAFSSRGCGKEPNQCRLRRSSSCQPLKDGPAPASAFRRPGSDRSGYFETSLGGGIRASPLLPPKAVTQKLRIASAAEGEIKRNTSSA